MSSMHMQICSGKVGFSHFDQDEIVPIEQLDIIHEYNEMKISKKHKYIIMKVSIADYCIVMTDVGSPSATFEDMKSKLPRNECRYVVHSLPVDGARRLVFILWCPDQAKIKEKIYTTSSKDTLRKRLVGISRELSATDLDEIDEGEFMQRMSTSFVQFGPPHA